MKAANKNIFREIKATKGRFMSIFLICAIGVGFFSGVRATENDMRVSADDYYDQHDLFDLRVMSSFGLTDGDVEAIRGVEDVSGVYPSKYTDLAMFRGDKEMLTRVYSLTEDINSIDITDGRMPQAEDECIISYNILREGAQVGDVVRVEDITDAEEFPLKYTEYKVVGLYETPMFISLTQRGSTTIGDGSIDAFMCISESNFTQEVYTEIYIKSDKMKGMQSYSDEYEELRDSISERLEQLAPERNDIRYEEVTADAIKKIEDGEKELEEAKADGQKELDDAKTELEDAERKIADGEKELADAKIELDDGAKQLEEAEQTLADALKELEDGRKELADNKAVIDSAGAQLADSRAELLRGEEQLTEAREQLDESLKQLDDGQAEIDRNAALLAESREKLNAAKEELASGRAEYEAGYAQYEQGLAEYNTGAEQLAAAEQLLLQAEAAYGADNPIVIQQRAEYEAAKRQLDQSKAILDATAAQLGEAKQTLDAGDREIAAGEAELSQGEEQLAAAQREIDSGREQYNEGLAQYEEARRSYEEGRQLYLDGLTEYNDGLDQYYEGFDKLEEGQREYDEGAATLAEKRAEYEDGLREYNDGLAEIEDAKRQYEDGLKEYEEGVETFNTEIAEAEQKLADARQELADAGNPEWYIFTREDNIGYAEYESNSQRIGRIAAIFPIFFLLVAGLVCLTTMSRMVEEQRSHIGTFKALGYSNGAIMKQYMIYAISAAAVGSLIGAAAGCFIFPGVIIYAYSMMYSIREVHFLLEPGNIIFSVAAMTAAIAVTVFFSCKKALAESPAELMRPKAPKAGKRVLIEKIGLIWNNIGFFGKVTCRNLFRYKRRMFMTVVGIAGCTALSLTGFGLKDSITDIVDLQYNEIYNYSGYLALDSDLSEAETRKIYEELADYDPETLTTRALIKQYTLYHDSAKVDCYVTCVEDAEIFGEMVDMHERKSGGKISLTDGAVATEKLTKLLDVQKGDNVTIMIDETVGNSVAVSGITEHYASHYLYMTEELYETTFGEAPEYNMIYFTNGITSDDEAQAQFSERMLSLDGVMAVMMNAGASSSFSDTIKIMDLVIIVLIVSAGALAFVVLYNLINVNITERIREIATLKVLGFYDREVSSYVFRENIILSVMGSAAGLLLGVALCEYVIVTAEIDEVMFGREIHPLSFLWAFLITVGFSLVVNQIMTRVLKKISMVESLKSVE
ncbi:MAG: ABC transporter permease [Oscillospiraceae bacterium]|nr:ABC transporter permease [Oscillospiraceae bacterium]